MSSDRGMKKWAPFSSLTEQSVFLEQMKYERNKTEKPKLSNEKANKINAILSNYHGETLTIKYFYDGYIYQIKTALKKVDSYRKQLVLDDGNIPFTALVDIDSPDYFDF